MKVTAAKNRGMSRASQTTNEDIKDETHDQVSDMKAYYQLSRIRSEYFIQQPKVNPAFVSQ